MYSDEQEYNGDKEFKADIHHSCETGGHVSVSEGEFIIGNVTKEIKIGQDAKFSELKADIQVKKVKTIRIWGQVRDCNGEHVSNALVKLVKESRGSCGKLEYVGIAHGVTDCLGFYQFDVCVPKNSVPNTYRVIVSKQALGKEVYMNANECNPCKDKHSCAE